VTEGVLEEVPEDIPEEVREEVPEDVPEVCLAAFRPPSWANTENPQQIKKINVIQIV
jgi:hypothetical protein